MYQLLFLLISSVILIYLSIYHLLVLFIIYHLIGGGGWIIMVWDRRVPFVTNFHQFSKTKTFKYYTMLLICNMGESARHKLLKLDIAEELKKEGHSLIQFEYSFKVPKELQRYNYEESIRVDIVTLDKEKKAFECGEVYIPEESWRRNVIESHGFRYIHIPFSEVRRIKRNLLIKLEKISVDINQALEKLFLKLDMFEDNTDPILKKSEIENLIEDKIEQAKRGY